MSRRQRSYSRRKKIGWTAVDAELLVKATVGMGDLTKGRMKEMVATGKLAEWETPDSWRRQ